MPMGTRISRTLVVITSIGFMMSINNFRLSFNNVRVVVDLFIMNPMLVITTSVPLILVTMGTLVVLTVRTRRSP